MTPTEPTTPPLDPAAQVALDNVQKAIDADAANAGTVEKKPKGKSPIPSADYNLVAHGTELPPNAPAAPRQTRPQLIENLTLIAQEPGTWFTVAAYQDVKGAARVLKLIVERAQAIPTPPTGMVYEIDKLRTATGSSLVARLVAE